MQVVADGEPGRAAAAQLLTLGDLVTDLRLDRREVRVERLQAEAVIDDDRVAVDRERSREGDDAGVGGGHRRVLRRGEVVAEVDLRVHGAAVIDVRARLGEVREDLGVAGLHEGAFPQGNVGGLGADLTFRHLRLLALLAIDHEERIEHRLRRRALRQQLGHLRLQERLADLDGVAWEGARLELAGDRARGNVAGLVPRGHGDGRARSVIVRQRDERHAHAFVRRAVGERRERARADGDVGALGIAHAERDELDAAGRHVSRGREHVELGRREIDGRGHARDRPLRATVRSPEVVVRPDLDNRRALAQSHRRRLESHRNLAVRPERRVRLRHGHRAPALHDAHLDARDVAARSLQRHRERRRRAERARHGERCAHAGHGLTPAEIGDRCDDGEDHEKHDDEAALEARARLHVASYHAVA